jgi:hypothetical protein
MNNTAFIPVNVKDTAILPFHIAKQEQILWSMGGARRIYCTHPSPVRAGASGDVTWEKIFKGENRNEENVKIKIEKTKVGRRLKFKEWSAI